MTDPTPTSPDQPGTAASWLSEIKRAQRSGGMDTWGTRCDRIRKRYRYEGSQETKVRRYQLLWSNMETMKPSVYTRPPQAAVMRRWKDKDPTARVASDMLERCINFTLEANDFDSRLKQVRDDFLLYARGVARLYYEPVMEDISFTDGANDLDVEAVQGDQAATDAVAPQQRLAFEHVKIAYVQRADFVHQIARTWDEVSWVAFQSFLTRDELRTRFPEQAESISLDASPERTADDRSTSDTGMDDKATVWEIWDKSRNRVLWVAKGYADILEEGEPYLEVEGFYPCPRPAYGTLTNDSLEPVPDYAYYQDQAEEIDELTARIGALTDSLKVVGFYPAGPSGEGAPEIERAAKPGFENKMVAVKSWAAFKEGGSGGAPIVWWPVEQVIKVLEGCVTSRQHLIDDVYQIYGLSDIMRGDGEASETATAQSIKAQFGSVRIRDRQQELARFCRDICRMAGEIMCRHFQPTTLMAMSNMPLPSEAELQQKQMMAALQAQAQAPRPQLPMGGPAPMPQPGLAAA